MKKKNHLIDYIGSRGFKTAHLSNEEVLDFARRLFKLPPYINSYEGALKYVRGLSKRHRRLLVAEARGWVEPPNPADPGGISGFYDSWEWKRARYDFLKAKNRRCQCCGATPESGIRIVVDHIKPIRWYWHLRLDPKNLQLLCDDCNMGKGSRDQTDWRGPNVVDFPDEEVRARMAAIESQLAPKE